MSIIVTELVHGAKKSRTRRSRRTTASSTSTRYPWTSTGADQSRREALFEAGFRTKEDLQNASKEELMAVDGVGARLADAILDAVGASTEEASSEEHVEEETSSSEAETTGGASSGTTAGTDPSGGGDGSESDEGATEAGISEEIESVQETLTADEGEEVVPVKLDQDKFEEIRRKIGLPQDAEVEDIGEALGTKLVSMYAIPVRPDQP